MGIEYVQEDQSASNQRRLSSAFSSGSVSSRRGSSSWSRELFNHGFSLMLTDVRHAAKRILSKPYLERSVVKQELKKGNLYFQWLNTKYSHLKII